MKAIVTACLFQRDGALQNPIEEAREDAKVKEGSPRAKRKGGLLAEESPRTEERRTARTEEAQLQVRSEAQVEQIRGSQVGLERETGEDHRGNQESPGREEKSRQSEGLRRVKRSVDEQASVRNIPSDKSGKEV